MADISTSQTIFLFAGQGSQQREMGRKLFEQDQTFRRMLLDVDNEWARQANYHFIPALYGNDQPKSAMFTDLRYTHIAIVGVEYALAKTLIAHGIRPTAVLGVSIGEVAAMLIADAISLSHGVYAVWRQVQQIMHQCRPAAMLAVLSTPYEFDSDPLYQKTSLAAVNFNQHFVVTGELADISALEQALAQRGVSYQRLPIEYGFHANLIDAAEASYLNDLATVPVAKPGLTYFSCADANKMSTLPTTHIWHAVRQPIRLQATIQQIAQHIDGYYIDVGPGGTMATMFKYNLPHNRHDKIKTVLSPFGDDYARLTSLCNLLGQR